MNRKKPKPKCNCLCCGLYYSHPDREHLCPDAVYLYQGSHNSLPLPQRIELSQYNEVIPALQHPPGQTAYFITTKATDFITTGVLDDIAQISGSGTWEVLFCQQS